MPMSRLEISAKSKIKSGLDKYLAGKVNLSADVLSPTELAKRVGVIAALAAQSAHSLKINDQFARLHVQTEATITSAIKTIHADFNKRGWEDGERPGTRIDTMGATVRKKLIDREVKDARKEAIAPSSDERAEGLVATRELKQVIAAAYKAWRSVEGVLMRRTVGDKDRDVYVRNLAQQGPSGLEDAFFEAIATDNPAMGAAVIQRLDSIGAEAKKLIPFTKADVAEHFIKKDFDAAHVAIKQMELNVRQAEIFNRRIEGVRINPLEILKIGALKAALGITPAGDNEIDPNSVDVSNDAEMAALKQQDFEAYLDKKYPGKKLPDGWNVDDGDTGNTGTTAAQKAMRAADKIYWAAEEVEKGTGDAAVEAFKAGDGA